MIIAVDFDGTCVKHAYPKIGEDIGAVPVLKEMVRQGHHWFAANDIPLTGANHYPGQETWTQSSKTFAQIYIDDAALGCPTLMDERGRIFVDWRTVAKAFGYKYDELCNKN